VARPFVVQITDLRRAIGSRRDYEVEGPLGDLELSGAQPPPGAHAVAKVKLESMAGDAVLATGTVTAPWVGECRRCLGEARGTVEAEVRELFEERADDEDIYPLRGDQIDLEPLVRDAVLLELPLAPLCAEDCAGLCPSCGVAADQGCDCVQDDRDPRWAALEQLRTDDRES
jgi:uncharacterized protein